MELTICPNLMSNYEWNYRSIYQGNVEDILSNSLDCWHLREPYFSKNLITRIPIPVTKNGKPIFYCGYISNSKQGRIISMYNKDKFSNDFYIENLITTHYIQAKYVEVLVAPPRFLGSFGIENNPMFQYNIFAVRASEIINIPTHPNELSILLRSEYKNDFNFTFEDVLKSIDFWRFHSFVNY